MCDSMKKFKEEMEKLGLFRKITVVANLIPHPPGIDPEAVIALNKLAAKEAVIMYAQKHDDFCELMAEAATDHLLDTILTDELFKPVDGFTPTEEEQVKMKKAEEASKMIVGLFDLLKRF